MPKFSLPRSGDILFPPFRSIWTAPSYNLLFIRLPTCNLVYEDEGVILISSWSNPDCRPFNLKCSVAELDLTLRRYNLTRPRQIVRCQIFRASRNPCPEMEIWQVMDDRASRCWISDLATKTSEEMETAVKVQAGERGRRPRCGVGGRESEAMRGQDVCVCVCESRAEEGS
jgi:hypothetical protein